MEDTLNDLGDYIAGKAGRSVISWDVTLGELSIVTTRDSLSSLMKLIRDDSNCLLKVLVDVTATDYPEREERFEIVYNLLSLSHNHRVRVKVATDEKTPVPSIVPLFSAAGWFEREVWDMFGVFLLIIPICAVCSPIMVLRGTPCEKTFL